jgi:hypothetical protein
MLLLVLLALMLVVLIWLLWLVWKWLWETGTRRMGWHCHSLFPLPPLHVLLQKLTGWKPRQKLPPPVDDCMCECMHVEIQAFQSTHMVGASPADAATWEWLHA